MDTGKQFKIILFIGIAIALLVNLCAAFDFIRLSEDDLVSLAYFWVFPIIYGLVGLRTYKRAEGQGKSVHGIPAISAVVSVFLLIIFFVAVFPSL